jgi:phage shock protein E
METFWWVTGGIAASYTVVAGLQLYSLLGKYRLSASQAKQRIKNGDIRHVIDVRTDLEWKAGHYDDAIHIPIATIPKSKKLNKIPKSSTLLVYCNTGQRARRAAELLRKDGYQNVYYIAESYRSLN